MVASLTLFLKKASFSLKGNAAPSLARILFAVFRISQVVAKTCLKIKKHE
jgi:hypothetical protein